MDLDLLDFLESFPDFLEATFLEAGFLAGAFLTGGFLIFLGLGGTMRRSSDPLASGAGPLTNSFSQPKIRSVLETLVGYTSSSLVT